MKKISSKIIGVLLLTTILWGSLGFDLKKDQIILGLKTQTVEAKAQVKTQAEISAEQMQNRLACQNKYPNKGPDYAKCIDAFLSRQGKNWKTDLWDWSFKVENAVGDKVAAAADFAKNKAVEAFTYLLFVILIFFNSLVTLAGNLFDMAINYSILQISTYTGIHEAILTVWSTIRDVLNIVFIFALLWVSLKTIVSLSNANTKKVLASVIIAALLINFSLFITRVAIDLGNYVAVAMYERVLTDIPPDKDGKQYISTALMENLGLSTLYTASSQPSEDSATNPDTITALLIKIILVVIVSWAFFFASFLFIARIITFFILMALSPIGFIGDIIPYLKPYAKKWWDTLYGQSLVAPIFLLFMFLLIKVASTGSFIIDTTGASQISITSYFNFALIIALLIMAVKITQKLSGEAGSLLTSLGAGVLGAGLGLAIGGGASFLRRKVGAKALETANDQGLKDRAAEGDVGARLKLAVAQRASKSSFDIRNTKAGGLFKKAGLDVNKGVMGVGGLKKGGFAQTVKDAEKKAEEEAKSYGEIPEEHTKKIVADAELERYELTQLESMVARTPEQQRVLVHHRQAQAEYNRRFAGVNEAENKEKFIARVIKKERLEALEARERRQEKILGKYVGFGTGKVFKAKADRVRKSMTGKSDEQEVIEKMKKIIAAEAAAAPAAAQPAAQASAPAAAATPPTGAPRS